MSKVIDTKLEKHSYKVLFTEENINTTLSLIYTEKAGNFGLNYDSVFSGVKSGHVQGGPIFVSGNTTAIVNQSPRVTVLINQFNNDIQNNYISLNVIITVDIPVIGTQTIFNQTLANKYTPNIIN